MTPPPPGAAAVAATVFLAFVFLFRPFPVDAFGGSSTTVAVSYGSSPTVCSLVADQSTHQIQCWRDGKVKPPIYAPSASFDSIAGGQDTICAIRSGGYSLICWSVPDFTPKRVYYSGESLLARDAVGDTQICALINGTQTVSCWRGSGKSPNGTSTFSSISSGLGFSCGVLEGRGKIECWASTESAGTIASEIESQFANGEYFRNVPEALYFESIVAGLNYTCGLVSENFSVICWGPGWPSNLLPPATGLPLNRTLRGPCVQSTCRCGLYPQSQTNGIEQSTTKQTRTATLAGESISSST